jgi:hypothetical protein
MFAASGYHLALSPEEWLSPDIFSQMVGGSNSLQLGTWFVDAALIRCKNGGNRSIAHSNLVEAPFESHDFFSDTPFISSYCLFASILIIRLI